MMRIKQWACKLRTYHFFVCCDVGPKTNAKLVMAGMAFVQWIARMVLLFAVPSDFEDDISNIELQGANCLFVDWLLLSPVRAPKLRLHPLPPFLFRDC